MSEGRAVTHRPGIEHESLPPEATAQGAATSTTGWVRWSAAVPALVVSVLATAGATGIPTDLIPNPWFTRMTPIQGYAYPVWGATTLLAGVLLAVHLGVGRASCEINRAVRPAGALGIVGSFLAVGCPICNKLVVMAIGATGATSYFAPIQPALAGVSLLLLVAALAVRLRAVAGGRRAP